MTGDCQDINTYSPEIETHSFDVTTDGHTKTCSLDNQIVIPDSKIDFILILWKHPGRLIWTVYKAVQTV